MSQYKSSCQLTPVRSNTDQIAREIKLIIRNSSKLSAAGFHHALPSSVATGLASLNQIAGDLNDRNHFGMASQSFHERFYIRSTAS